MSSVATAGVTLTVAPSLFARSTPAKLDEPVRIATAFRRLGSPDSMSTVRLSDFPPAKKTVVLVFLANRCGVTWLYADKIAGLVQRYRNREDVVVLGIHSNSEESDRELTDALAKRGLKIPVLDDKPKQEIARYFGAKVTPYFVVIDANGVFRYKGPFDKMGGSVAESKRQQYLNPALDAVVAGKPVALKSVRALGCEITPRRPGGKE